MSAPKDPISDEDLAICRRVLDALVEEPTRLSALSVDERRALLTAAGRLSRPDRDDRRRIQRTYRRRDREERLQHDVALLAAAATRGQRRTPGFPLPPGAVDERGLLAAPVVSEPASDEELHEARACYICKRPYRSVHFFYHAMCGECGDFNYDKRRQTASLDGKVALVTGARIKIGYHAALILLRAGAEVVATTRFPRDAAVRFAAEPDFAVWAPRLRVVGLDLRHLQAVETVGAELARTLPRLDIVLHNAAQTVRRPAAFYRHLIEAETETDLPPSLRSLLELDARLRQAHPSLAAVEAEALAPRPSERDLLASPVTRLASVEGALAFPVGRYDGDGQQVDLREANSWRMRLSDVPTVELIEVMLVNAAAPFILTRQLRPLMERDRTDEKHIVNVSAMEAQFARNKKTDKHPHTNMAKASLNMMTRTAAPDFAEAGIFMNSVDTGWVTDEDPLHHVVRKQDVHDFHPPLDAVDGAARVLDPLFVGLRLGQHPFGRFFKDYREIPW